MLARLHHAVMRQGGFCLRFTLLLLVGDAGEIYVEVVRGLGETLVGGSPGTPLRFSAKKGLLAEEAAATAAANKGLPQDCLKVHGLLSCDPAHRF